MYLFVKYIKILLSNNLPLLGKVSDILKLKFQINFHKYASDSYQLIMSFDSGLI